MRRATSLTRLDARGVTATYSLRRAQPGDHASSTARAARRARRTPSPTTAAPMPRAGSPRLIDPAGTTTLDLQRRRARVATKAQTMGSITHTLTYGYNAGGPAGHADHALGPGDRVQATLNNRSWQRHGQRATLARRRLSPRRSVRSGALAVGQRPIHLPPITTPMAGWRRGSSATARSMLRNDLSFDAASRITAVADPDHSDREPAPTSTTCWTGSRWRSRATRSRTPAVHLRRAGQSHRAPPSTGASPTCTTRPHANRLQCDGGRRQPQLPCNGAQSALTSYTYNNANRLVADARAAARRWRATR